MKDLNSDFIKQIEESHIWLQMFDEIRLVKADGSNQICLCENGALVPTSELCYHFFQKSEKCKSCICSEKNANSGQMVKIEYLCGHYYLVLSKPVILLEKSYIAEFITDITTSFAAGGMENMEGGLVTDLIKQLETVSTKDSFTGLYNKTFMITKVETLLKQANCSGKSFYIALMDIDDFKRINDTYGHLFGDKVLLNISQKIMKIVTPDVGLASRFGGDEFGVIFYSAEEKECLHILEKIKSEINGHIYDAAQNSLQITISAGFQNVTGECNFEGAFKLVDESLYCAKRKGKPAFSSKELYQ